MHEFRLVRPAAEHRQQAMEYLEEFYADKSETHGVGGLEKFQDNYDGWLTKLEQDRVMMPNEERVPAETFFLVKKLDDGTERIIGTINIRLALNDALWMHGGNIGYSIRPSERRKGYNKINLYLALCFCQKRGMEAVMLDCDKNNLGSAKTMRALGGKLIREYYYQKTPDAKSLTQCYIIDVDASLSRYADEYGQFVAEYAE